jgi:signal transduction histidine kinase
VSDLQRLLAPIREVAEVAQGDQAVPDLLRRVCTVVAVSFGLRRVGVLRSFARPEGEVVGVVAHHGAGEAVLGLHGWIDGSPALQRAASSGSTVFVGDARSEPSFPPEVVNGLGIVSGFVIPLFSQGRSIGFLLGDRGGTAFELSADELDLLACVGVLVGTLLEKELVREELVRLDEAKTQFVALASHELRTPIAAVYGLLATLHNVGGRLREEQRVELRSTAFVQAERLRTLAEQLLDLSRLDAASIRLNPQATPVRRMLEEIVLLVGEQRASEVAIDAAAGLKWVLDRAAFDRIVSNLLVNALRYGAPPVRIDARRCDRHLRLAVEDAGEGVPAEFVPSLFERFTRSERSAGQFSAGAGLGLSIARAYARAHGGEISYCDAVPHGARFELVIPVN